MKVRVFLPIALVVGLVSLVGVPANAFELLGRLGGPAYDYGVESVYAGPAMDTEIIYDGKAPCGGETVCGGKGCSAPRPRPLQECCAKIKCACLNLQCRIQECCDKLKARLSTPCCFSLCEPCCDAPICGFPAQKCGGCGDGMAVQKGGDWMYDGAAQKVDGYVPADASQKGVDETYEMDVVK
jgi:hypothetical protein